MPGQEESDSAVQGQPQVTRVVIAGQDVAMEGSVIAKDHATVHQGNNVNTEVRYEPQQWERITAVVAALAWVGLVGYLVVRNEPLDPNLVVFVRILLSVFAGILGATIPGFLHVRVSGPGFMIRAGGALALFVLTYFFTPAVIL